MTRLTLEEYDPSWPAAASAAMTELSSALPALFTRIEHIGSTSVPGPAAKPVIDLMAAAETLEAVITREGELAGLGYQCAKTGMPSRLLYVRHQNGRTSHHLHVVLEAGWESRNERLLRDYLHAHPEDAARYARLKADLVAQHASPAEYTRGKTALIQELTDRARSERGLPSVAVWEE